MIQIFVKVNGPKTTPIEVNLTDDKVEDMLKQIQKDEDVYVTMHGRVLKRSERLKDCEVTDGCTIQVTDRLRGGGRHKDKRNRAETRQGTDASGQKDQQDELSVDKYQEMTQAMTQAQKDIAIQPLETSEIYQTMITMILEAEDEEHKIQHFGKQLQEILKLDEEGAKKMEWGIRWAVEARNRRKDAEQGQRRQEEQRQNTEQEKGKKGKQVRFGEEEETKETQAESTDEQKVRGRTTEVQTGRGSAGFVQGRDERCRADETRKGKGKGNGGKGEHEGKRGAGSKGRQQVENSVIDEDQGNTGAMRNEEEEENHREDVRKLVEMMQKKENAHERQRDRWRLTWELVAHTPRPCRSQKQERPER